MVLDQSDRALQAEVAIPVSDTEVEQVTTGYWISYDNNIGQHQNITAIVILTHWEEGMRVTHVRDGLRAMTWLSEDLGNCRADGVYRVYTNIIPTSKHSRVSVFCGQCQTLSSAVNIIKQHLVKWLWRLNCVLLWNNERKDWWQWCFHKSLFSNVTMINYKWLQMYISTVKSWHKSQNPWIQKSQCWMQIKLRLKVDSYPPSGISIPRYCKQNFSKYRRAVPIWQLCLLIFSDTTTQHLRSTTKTRCWEDVNDGGWVSMDVLDGSNPGHIIGWHQWPCPHAHHSSGRGTQPQIRTGIQKTETAVEFCCWWPPRRCVSPFNSRVLRSFERLGQQYSHRIFSDGIVDSRWVLHAWIEISMHSKLTKDEHFKHVRLQWRKSFIA